MNLNNTAVRIIVSFITIPIILLLCYLGGIFFLSFVLVIGLVSFYEFSLMVEKKESYINKLIGFLSVFLLIVNSYFRFSDFYWMFILVVSSLLIYELFRNKQSAILNLGSTLLGVFYIGLFSSSIILVRELFPADYVNGGYLIISILATIWICDSAAFFIGSSFGKHKLFPRVSPKKSWEGAVAGFLFSILSMLAARYIILNFLSLADVLIIGTIIGTIGQIGDLTESLIKRDSGVKDSSALIPGHGGIFDRFDSFLFSTPVIYVYLAYVFKV